MKIKRCALVVASILAVCTVAFLCRQRLSVETEGQDFASSSAQRARAVVSAVSAAVPAVVAPSSNQTATVRGTKPYVLTCGQSFNQSLRLAAEALGVRTVSVLGRKSLLVEADAAAVARVAADGRFAVETEFLPSEKIAPQLAAAIAGGAKTVDVTFLTLSEEDRRIVQGRIAARGGEILGGCLNTEDTFSARLPAGLVAELASCGDVRWMEQFVRPHLMNNIAVGPELMNVSNVWLSADLPEGLSGAGQVVSTSDSGIDLSHQDLVNQVVWTNVVSGCYDHDVLGHGTHTAGSIVGDGTMWTNETAAVRGTAWGAQLCAWFCGRPDGMLDTPDSFEDLFRPDQENHPAFIHSASWGNKQNPGSYTARCESMDRYLWEHPEFLPVFSAGNEGSGSGTIGDPASAKNVLAVGATQSSRIDHDGGWGNGDPTKTAVFSSRGPCKDGRTKPDIAAPGVGILSTRSYEADYSTYGVDSNTNYAYDSGTSMACPLTAGAMALVREWLVKNPAAWKVEGRPEVPTAALMKAIVTGGAKGVSVPNNDQGWGRVDLMETLAPSNRAVKLIDRISLADGDERAWIVETTDAAPLDVQLAWVDYPGSANGSQEAPRLINDIDLTVRPLGTDDLHYGNGGDGPDVLNNLESVRLPDAAKGRYLVTVSGKDLPYDYTGDNGAVALYIRGAFDPDEVVERYTVRIVRTPETTNTYARLDKALNDAVSGDVIEILDATVLGESVVLTNDCALTVIATNANPYASPISRRKGADILVANGSLFFSNTVFAAETTTPVRVSSSGVVRVAGTAVFDDIASRKSGILTDRPQGFELAGELLNGITIECTKASQADDPFGVYSCSYEVASNCAPRLVSAAGTDRAGKATKDGFLIWKDDAPVDPAAAVAYVNGDEPVYYRTLERLFGEHSNGTNVVITKSGVRLEKPRTLTGKQSISAAEDLDTAVIHADGAAGFLIGAGCELTVSGLTFGGYKGNGLFVVNGEGARLTVTNSVFTDIEGTNKWSGAIVIRKGSASVSDSLFDNCRATGKTKKTTSMSYGGAIYLAGSNCSLELNGGTFTGCYAKTHGGGIYAAGGSVVRVRGALTVKGNWSGENKTADNIHLQDPNATLTLSGKLEGEDAVGVRYGAPASGWGNGVSNRFAAVEEGVAHEDAVASAKAFFNDVDPQETRAAVDGDPARNLLWTVRPRGDRSVDPDDPDATIRVTKGGEVRYYVRPEYAFEDWIDADATVEVLKDAEFCGDLVVTNGVAVTMASTNASPASLFRTSSFQIRVLSGASLTVSNLVLNGDNRQILDKTEFAGLVKVDGGSFELRPGAVVSNVFASADRASGGVSVWNGGTFTMRSGSAIVECRNSYRNVGANSGYGGGLLVEDHSTANLLGGIISDCYARRGGGVFIGTESTVNIAGDMTVSNCLSLGTYRADNLCVADLSKLRLVGPLAGKIGYNEGLSGDTNVFGKVDEAFSGDVQASAHNFTHDVTGDVGMAVSDGSETLLVWGSALDADGKYQEKGKTYSLVNRGEPLYVIPLPEGRTFVYDGTEKIGLEDGIGYVVVSGNVATVTTNHQAFIRARAGFLIEPNVTETNVLWMINPAPFDLTNDTDVAFKSRTFIYDGSWKYLAISGTLPDWLKVDHYEKNGRWEPGTNEVVAVIKGANPNYVPNPFETNLCANLVIIDPEGRYHGEIDPPPAPEYTVKTNAPTPIAFSAIMRKSDTEWELVVTDLVEQAEYALSHSPDLKTAFTTGAWFKASASGPWTTNVQFSAEDPKPAYFWRAHGRTTYVTNWLNTVR